MGRGDHAAFSATYLHKLATGIELDNVNGKQLPKARQTTMSAVVVVDARVVVVVVCVKE